MPTQRSAFSLIELLVVVAIVGVVSGLLLPALQAAREAARRIQCANNLHQLGLALHHYHDSHRSFPIGIVYPNWVMWSAQILPELEQGPLHATVDFTKPFSDGSTANGRACATLLDVFRCPSSNAPEHVSVQGVRDRVPGNYLAVASGTANRDVGPTNFHVGRIDQDGIMFVSRSTRMASIVDGTSQTLAIGECLFQPEVTGPDSTGAPQIVDHWYIGTAGMFSTDGNHITEASEALGSTGVAMSNWKDNSIVICEKEIAFSSNHRGGVQFVFADGHVAMLSDSLDRAIYSALGTRAGSEVIASEGY